MALPQTQAPVGQSLDTDSAVPFAEGYQPRQHAPVGLIAYHPSEDFTQETGISPDNYDIFRSYLAKRESNGYGEAPNSEGYMGRYQMGGAGSKNKEIAETAGRMGIPTPSHQEFLSDPQLQESMFENYTLNHHRQLMSNPAYANGDATDRMALLAGAHLGGPGGVHAWQNGVDRHDSNGTGVSSYIKGMYQAAGKRGGEVQVASNDPNFMPQSAIPMADSVVPVGTPSPPMPNGPKPIGPFESMPKAWSSAPKDPNNYWLKPGPNNTYSWVPRSLEPDLGVGPSPLYHPDEAQPENTEAVYRIPQSFSSQLGTLFKNMGHGFLGSLRDMLASEFTGANSEAETYLAQAAMASGLKGITAGTDPRHPYGLVNPIGQDTALGKKLNDWTEPEGEGWPSTVGYYAGQGAGFTLPFGGIMAGGKATALKGLGTLINETLIGAGSGAMQGDFHELYTGITGRSGDVGDIGSQIIGAMLFNPLRVAAISTLEGAGSGVNSIAQKVWNGARKAVGAAKGLPEGAEEPVDALNGGKLMDATLSQQFGTMLDKAKNHVEALGAANPADSASVMAEHAGAAREAGLAFAKSTSDLEKKLFQGINRDLPRDFSETQTLYRQMMRDHFSGTLRAEGNFPTEVENLLFPNRSHEIKVPGPLGEEGAEVIRQPGLDQVDKLGRGMDVKARLGGMIDDELAAAGRSVDRAKVGYLKRLQASLTNDLQHGSEGANPDETDAYRMAMAFSSGRSRIMNSPEMEDLLNKNVGAPQAMDKLLAQGPAGAAGVNLLTSVAQRMWGSEGLLGAAQDYLRQKYRNAVAPAGYVSQDAHNRFMMQHGATLDDPAFDAVKQQFEQAAKGEQNINGVVGFGKPGGFGQSTGRQASREDAAELYMGAPSRTVMEALEGARNQKSSTEAVIKQLQADPSGRAALGLQHIVADRILADPKYLGENPGIVSAIEGINPGFTERANYWANPSTVGGMAKQAADLGLTVLGSKLTRPFREGDSSGSLAIAGRGAKAAREAGKKLMEGVSGINSAAIVDPGAHAAWQRTAQHLPSSYAQQALDAALLHAYVPGMIIGNFGVTKDARPEGQQGMGAFPAAIPGVGGAPPLSQPPGGRMQ